MTRTIVAILILTAIYNLSVTNTEAMNSCLERFSDDVCNYSLNR